MTRNCTECQKPIDAVAQQKFGNKCSAACARKAQLKDQEPLNRLDFADDPAEFELQQELQRLCIKNEPRPTSCDCLIEGTDQVCGKELFAANGLADEAILVCPDHSIVWEDSEGAIRNVY